MIISPIFPDDCVECARLCAKYEAATFAQARLQNALDRAQLLHDHHAIRRFTLEAYDIETGRETARAIFRQHQNAAHRRADSVGADCGVREEDAEHSVETPGFMAANSTAFARLENPC